MSELSPPPSGCYVEPGAEGRATGTAPFQQVLWKGKAEGSVTLLLSAQPEQIPELRIL